VTAPTILILQGGGALGAYEAGAYLALAPSLSDLAVVAGTSMGAINASFIATHYPEADHGAPALSDFWTNVLARPSFPFVPAPGVWQRWNALYTSLLLGNPHIALPRWWLGDPPTSFDPAYLYSTRPLAETLARSIGSYGPQRADPRLIVTAVDVEAGTVRAFDSWREPVTHEKVLATSSIPPWYPAQEIAGRFYWDGGLWTSTPLAAALNTLQADPTDSQPPAYRVIIIDVFPQRGALPRTGLEVNQRMQEIIYADKTADDQRAAEWVNRHIRFVQTLRSYTSQLPPSPLRERIEHEYQQLRQVERRVLLDITTIKRQASRYEYISDSLDYSPERIAALIDQGRRDAEQAIARAP